jgi:hypothetical protein
MPWDFGSRRGMFSFSIVEHFDVLKQVSLRLVLGVLDTVNPFDFELAEEALGELPRSKLFSLPDVIVVVFAGPQ